MIGKGALGHAGSLNDIAHAGAGEPVLMNHLEPGGEDFLAMRWP